MAAGGYRPCACPSGHGTGKIGANAPAAWSPACSPAAIQIKYAAGGRCVLRDRPSLVPASRRRPDRPGRSAPACSATLGIAPTLAAILYFQGAGSAAFDAFWFPPPSGFHFDRPAARAIRRQDRRAARGVGGVALAFVLAAAMARRFSIATEALAIWRFARLAAALITFCDDRRVLRSPGAAAALPGDVQMEPALGRSRLAAGLAADSRASPGRLPPLTERDLL